MKKKYLRLVIGLLITILAMWLSFRELEWKTLRETFSGIRFFWVGAVMVNTMVTVYVLGLRWRILMDSTIKMPLYYMFQLNTISQYLNIIIPGRFGELAKAWLPARRYDVSGSYVLGTIVIEKMFDSFTWLALWVTVPAFFAIRDKLRGYTIALVISGIVVLALVFVVWKRELVRKWFYAFARWLPEKMNIRQRILNFLDRGMDAFIQLKNPKTILLMAFYSVVIIMLSTLSNFLLFFAFGFQLSFFQALIILLLVQVGSAPPSLPGKLGVFEYMVILGLSLSAIGKAEAMGYAIMLHIVSYLPKIILGFIFMTSLNFSVKKAEAAMSELNDKNETTENTEDAEEKKE